MRYECRSTRKNPSRMGCSASAEAAPDLPPPPRGTNVGDGTRVLLACMTHHWRRRRDNWLGFDESNCMRAMKIRERAVAFRTRVDGLLAELTHASAQLHLAQRGRLARRRTHAQEPIAAALVELRRAHASAKAEHSALCADLRGRRAEIVDDLSWRVFCTRLEHDFEHEAQPVRAAKACSGEAAPPSHTASKAEWVW